MNYTINEASNIRVGDTLTLEDGSKHELVKHKEPDDCINCSLDAVCKDYHYCRHIPDTHFKKIKP